MRAGTSLDKAPRITVYLSDMWRGRGNRCDAAISVPCSSENNSNVLLDAVLEANASPGPDTIELAQGCTYTFFQAAFVSGGWFGNNALPAIASEITIEGNGAPVGINSPTR